MTRPRFPVSVVHVAHAVGIVLFVVVLYVAKEVFIPLSLGLLLAFLFSPLADRIQRLGLSNLMATLLMAVVVCGAVSLLGIVIWKSAAEFANNLPQHRQELSTKVDSVQGHLQRLTQRLKFLDRRAPPPLDTGTHTSRSAVDRAGLPESVGEPAPPPIPESNRITPPDSATHPFGRSPNWPLYVEVVTDDTFNIGSLAGGLGIILGPLATAGLVTVFAFFALLYRDDLRDRFVAVISRGNYVVTTEAIDEASGRVRRYLVAQLMLNVSYGTAFGLGLWGIGGYFSPDSRFPNIILLAVLAGLLRFIPYLGPFIGAGIPLLVALVSFPGYTVAIAVGILIVVMELVSNNLVEPWLYGSSTGVSAVAIILGAVFWGWLWGPIGLLLATPLTVCLVVLGQKVPRFRFFATLLSDEIYVRPDVRAYQRLLAGDPHKLLTLITTELTTRGPIEVLDAVIIPTIRRMLLDQEPHHLHQTQLLEQLQAAVSEADRLIGPVKETGPHETSVDNEFPQENLRTLPACVGVPARHRGEALVLECLSQIMRGDCRMSVVPSAIVPEREAQAIARDSAPVVLIVVIPPGGILQAKYWCKALRQAKYEGTIVVAYLGKTKNFDRAFIQFRRAGANLLTTTAAQTCSKIRSLMAEVDEVAK